MQQRSTTFTKTITNLVHYFCRSKLLMSSVYLVKICYFLSCKLTFTRPHVFLTLSCTLLTLQWTVLFHSLNDRTQSANRIVPGAVLSGLNRYTQQHLSVCPWKWDCLCAQECLCITHSSCVYVEGRLE